MDNVKDYLYLRSSIYKLLSAPFYKEPTKADLVLFRKYIPILKEIALHSDEMTEGLTMLEAFQDDKFYNFDILASEFARLFLGVNKATAQGHTVTPHESVYLSASRLVMQESWEKVYEIYRNEGICKDESFKEPEDHITAEMNFMAHMSEKTAELLGGKKYQDIIKCLKVQEYFLTQHLCKWVPLLTEDLKVSGAHFYYLVSALLVQGFIDIDREFISELINEKEMQKQ